MAPRTPAFITASVTALAAAVVIAAPAAAAPEAPPVDPAPPPTVGIGNALAQNGSAQSGPFGLPDMSAYAPMLLLAQNDLPAEPGEQAAPAIPNLSAFNPAYLVGQNTEPAAPGEGTPAPGIGPGPQDPNTGRIAFLRRVHEMYEAGALKGALLGQQPPEVFESPAPAG